MSSQRQGLFRRTIARSRGFRQGFDDSDCIKRAARPAFPIVAGFLLRYHAAFAAAAVVPTIGADAFRRRRPHPIPEKGISMAPPAQLYAPDLEAGLGRLYRDFLDLAEKKRRWSLRRDIPWRRRRPPADPAVADVVESFCAV